MTIAGTRIARGSDEQRPSARDEPASGRQFELRHGDQRAVVVEVGAGLRSYCVGDRQLLQGYGTDEIARFAHGQTLIPWPNRIRDGAYTFAGAPHQLPINEPERGHAIHGLVRWANWSGEQDDPGHVRMRHMLHAREGYPFTLALALDYTLDAQGLTVATTATNAGERTCPYGAGAHPYVTLGAGPLDACVLQAPGAVRLTVDGRLIPTGTERVDGSEFDFRTPRRIGAQELDTAFTELERGADGLARVRLSDDAGDTAGVAAGVTVWQDHTYGYLMLFTGDAIPDPERRRRALGVEPMTCAPNAFRSQDGLIELAPGDTVVSRWGVTADLGYQDAAATSI